MIPRITQRGHSFKGAAQYYLHDKKAETHERVEWTHTHNLPTNDVHKAFGYMAYTAMNTDRLKRQARVSNVGRKQTRGAVYSYSLAWHPKEQPDQELMQNAALEVLAELGLSGHEAVLVAHNDTAHPHVHVVCNVVHPEHGRVMAPSYDFLTTSRWAENFEREHGEILVEQRVINNEKRRAEAKENRQLANIKHREEKLKTAEIIKNLYTQSDTGKSFQAALQTEGFTLAKGDRRSYVLVDDQGKTYSLYRQLSGLKAKDINPRLKDIDQMPLASKLVNERQQNESRSEDRTAHKEHLPTAQQDFDKVATKQSVKPEFKRKAAPQATAKESPSYRPDDLLRRLDELREWEQKTQRQKDRLTAQLEQQYDLARLDQQICLVARRLRQNGDLWARLSGKQKTLQEQFKDLQSNKVNIHQRMEEEQSALHIKSLETRPEFTPEENQEVERHLQMQQEAKQKKLMEDMRYSLDRLRHRGRSMG